MRKLALEDFGGGMWSELDAPAGYVYDAQNAVVDGTDLRLRGATAYRGTEAAHAWFGLAAAELAAGARLVAWDTATISCLSADGSTMDTVAAASGADRAAPLSRAVTYNGMLVMRKMGAPGLWAYGGSRLAPTSHSVSPTAGSAVLPGTGFGDVDAGMLFTLDPNNPVAVSSVESTTSLTLYRPSRVGTGAPTTGGFAQAVEIAPYQNESGAPAVSAIPFAAMATAGNKLLLASGNRVWVSIANYFFFNPNEFHGLNATVRGLEPLGASSVLVFTTEGVFVIDNVPLDLTDDAGNPQQQLRLLAPNVILWNDSGIAAWEGRAVVPALDDVYLFTPGEAPTPISGSIRSRYRALVAAGYRPGVAQVFNGHYFLPVLNTSGTVVEEMLVCRLDQPGPRGGLRPAWTHWPLLPAGVFAREPHDDGTIRLVGTTAQGTARLLDLSGTLYPSGPSTDANGVAPQLDVTTNDLATGPGNRNTVLRLRARYALEGSGVVVTPSLIVGPESGYTETDLAAGSAADGESGTSWRFTKRTERLRVRVRSSGGAAKLRLRTLELFVRDSSRP